MTAHEAVPTAEAPLRPATSVSSAPWRIAGVAVHLFTASGAVLGLFIVLAAFEGAVERALWLALAALVIDGTDGMLARHLRVSESIPTFDGARLDDIVDYLTYAFAPMVLLYTTGRLPDGVAGGVLASLPLLASGYQFCRTDAKTADHFFLGFPSYWNVVAFYVFVLDLGTTVTALILVTCAVFVFVPIRYLYPSRTKVYRGINITLTALWLVTYALLLLELPEPSPIVVALSLAYLGYYAGLSVYLSWVLPRRPPKRLSGAASDLHS